MQFNVRAVVGGRHDCCLRRPAGDPGVVRAVQLAELLLRRSADVEFNVHANLFAGDVVVVLAKPRPGAAAHHVRWHMDDVPTVALAVEAPPGLRHAILSADAPSNDALLSRGVQCISVAAAKTGAGLEGVKNAGSVQIAAPHLDFDFAQSGCVSAIGALQHDGAKAQVPVLERRALAGIQRGGDAATHCGRHARSALVVHNSGHSSFCEQEEWREK